MLVRAFLVLIFALGGYIAYLEVWRVPSLENDIAKKSEQIDALEFEVAGFREWQAQDKEIREVVKYVRKASPKAVSDGTKFFNAR